MLQVYTGEGKGKTTAGVGLAVRAASVFRVLFVQFIKDGTSSEIEVLKKIPGITVATFGSGLRIYPERENVTEKELIRRGFEFIGAQADDFEVIILDEAVTAVSLGLLSEEELLEVIGKISKETEVIITGHNASVGLIKAADLVTEVKKIKHYYDKGQVARKGIEF